MKIKTYENCEIPINIPREREGTKRRKINVKSRQWDDAATFQKLVIFLIFTLILLFDDMIFTQASVVPRHFEHPL